LQSHRPKTKIAHPKNKKQKKRQNTTETVFFFFFSPSMTDALPRREMRRRQPGIPPIVGAPEKPKLRARITGIFLKNNIMQLKIKGLPLIPKDGENFRVVCVVAFSPHFFAFFF
jgi:hypothetical protein